MATYDQMVNALRRAHAAGDVENATRIAQAIQNREYDEQQSDFVSTALGASQGATLGFGDEIAAGVRAGLGEFADKTLGATMYGLGIGVDEDDRGFFERFKQYRDLAEDDRSLGERYQQALESGRGALEVARREDPYATFGGELLGGLGTGGIAGGARAAAAKTLGQGIRSGMATGAGIGALAGYGYGEGDVGAALAFDDQGRFTPFTEAEFNPDRVRQELTEGAISTATGTAVGGIAGGALPALGAGARAIARNVRNFFSKNASLTDEGRQAVARAIQDDIDNGYITLDQARRELAETPGMTVADLGPATRELAEGIAQTPTAGGRQLRESLESRNRDQWKRIFPRLAQALGRDEDNFSAARRNLIQDMRQRADEAYGVAYQQPVRMTERMQQILATPSGRRALNQGKQLRANLEKDPAALDIRGAMQSTRDVDYIVQSFDDVVSQLYRSGRGRMATAAKDLRNEFRELIYQQNPSYREARQIWAGDKANENAMDLGLRLFRDDADMTADVVRSMTDGEVTHFKIGALRAIMQRLGNKSDTSDLTKGLFDRPNTREALRVAFGGRQQFDDFMRYIGREQRMFETFRQAVGNSATARRLAQAEGAGGDLASFVTYGGTGSLVAAGIARRAFNAMRPSVRAQTRQNQVGERQAQMLTQQGSTALDEIMRPVTGLLGTGPQPMLNAATGGLLATDITGQ